MKDLIFRKKKSKSDITDELHLEICLILDEYVFDIHEFLQTGDENKLKKLKHHINSILGFRFFDPFVIANYELSSGDVLDIDIRSIYNFKLYINKRNHIDIIKSFKQNVSKEN